MDLGLKDKVVLVTGGGAGIGRVHCLTFAEEGAHVAVNDLPPHDSEEKRWARFGHQRDNPDDVYGGFARSRMVNLSRAESVAEECRKLGVKAMAAEANVTDFEQVKAMVKKVIDEFGRIDVLVNNAGGSAPVPTFLDSTKEQWNWTIDICLYSTLYCTYAVLPHMQERKYGKIVNQLSDAYKGNERGLAVYGGAKAAVGSFTRAIAFENGRHGINANAVSIGATFVEHSKQRQKEAEEALKAMSEGKQVAPQQHGFGMFGEAQFKVYPLAKFYKGLGDPQDVANMVVFLSSDRARWITGQTISVSGGYVMWP